MVEEALMDGYYIAGACILAACGVFGWSYLYWATTDEKPEKPYRYGDERPVERHKRQVWIGVVEHAIGLLCCAAIVAFLLHW